MKTYNVYKHPAGMYEAVKNGWSWPGFFFGIFWSLVKKLWLVSLVLLGIAVALGGMLVTPEASLALQIIIACVVGHNGNKWREAKLRDSGYTLQGTSFAENGPTAVAKQISNTEN